MWVHPKQLVPGCLIISDVMGKTNRPIIPKNTVVSDIHINILRKFLIEQVEVASNLTNGLPFIPEDFQLEDVQTETNQKTEVSKSISFNELYWKAIYAYQEQYQNWQSGSPIDMNKVRNFAIPLFEKIDDIGLEIYLLHRFSSKQDYFYHHAVSMGIISAFIAKKRGIKKEWVQIGLAGLLADSGMSKLTRGLFKKEGKLTPLEYNEIKLHPTYSYRLVEKIPSLTTGAKLAILQHHERMDGTGYPMGVEKSRIHPYASILSVSDTYHAMTSVRLHQGSQSPFKVIEEMIQDQYKKYDHEMFAIFIKHLTNFSTGMKVKLSNNKLAEIVFVETNHPTRPMVRLLDNQSIVSLKDNRSIYIEEIIK